MIRLVYDCPTCRRSLERNQCCPVCRDIVPLAECAARWQCGSEQADRCPALAKEHVMREERTR